MSSLKRTRGLDRELARRLGTRLLTDVPVKDWVSAGVGGVADYLIAAETPADLMAAANAARELDIPVSVIGTGSHSLVSDYGCSGLMIINRAAQITFVSGRSHILVESGVRWSQVVLAAAGRQLGGLAPLLELPGSIGGTLASGAGASDLLPSSAIRHLTVLGPHGSPSQLAGTRLREGLAPGTIILTAVVQGIASRPDQIAAEIAPFERCRRKWETAPGRFLGPIVGARGARRPFAVADLLIARPRLFNLRVGNAAFSRTRPNYIEIRGRITARELRTLVTQIYHELSASSEEQFSIHCQFLGVWDDSLVSG